VKTEEGTGLKQGDHASNRSPGLSPLFNVNEPQTFQTLDTVFRISFRPEDASHNGDHPR
jgi:hypothetical protein